MSYWKENVLNKSVDEVLRLAKIVAFQKECVVERFVSPVSDEEVFYIFKSCGFDIISEQSDIECDFVVTGMHFYLVEQDGYEAYSHPDCPLGIVRGDTADSIISRCGEPHKIRGEMNVPVLGRQPSAVVYKDGEMKTVVTLGADAGTVSMVSLTWGSL